MFPETLLALNGYNEQFQILEKFGTGFEDSTLIDDPTEVLNPLASADRGEEALDECSDCEDRPFSGESNVGPGEHSEPSAQASNRRTAKADRTSFNTRGLGNPGPSKGRKARSASQPQ